MDEMQIKVILREFQRSESEFACFCQLTIKYSFQTISKWLANKKWEMSRYLINKLNKHISHPSKSKSSLSDTFIKRMSEVFQTTDKELTTFLKVMSNNRF